ncbi:GGDEF domain-containing protein [bacterium]|nr:GGDEF domain-containing protein [bacterium]
MNNLIIFSDNNVQALEAMCAEVSDVEVRVMTTDEIKNVEQYNPSVVVLDIDKEKLRELSMIMKFPVPVLIISDDMIDDINLRGEAFDFVLNPINKFELGLRIKNMLKIKELKYKVSNIATTDELTGLHNRKYMLERLDAEMSRAKRYHSTVSCILFDIDFFKVINDMYGYEWGDVLLKRIADMLLKLARKEDIVTRYGDEEFMVILPDTSEENAFIFAERFRRDVERMSFIPSGEDERHPVKISGGISSFPQMEGVDENSNTIIRYAEHALYNAKKRGKNRVVLFSQVNLEY